MKQRHFFLTVIILAFICKASFAQSQNSFLVKKVTIKGLPPETDFSSMQQDDDGFMWLGSLSGLFRYDGSRVTQFLRDPADSNSLTHNYANTLCKDEKGNIWIGTFGGFMNMYERNSEKIKRIEPGIKNELRPVVLKTKTALNGNIIAATAKCFYKINNAGAVTDSMLIPISQPGKVSIAVTDFIEYENDRFIITSTSGLFLLDWKKRNMSAISIPVTNHTNFSCIEKDGKGNFWIGSKQGLLVLNPDFSLKGQSTTGRYLRLNKAAVNAIKKDGIGRMWIGTDTGLFIADDTLLLKINTGQTDSIQGVNELFVDKNGTTWVSASFNKLFIVYHPGISFQTIPGMQLYSKNKQTQSILEEKPGTWLIGSMVGLYRYSFADKKFEEIKLPGTKNKKWIGCQLIDRNKGYWVGTLGEGVFYRPPGKNQFIQFKNDPIDSSFPFNAIVAIAEDNNGNIWMGSFNNGGKTNSLCYYDPRTGKINLIMGEAANPKTFNAVDISQIEADRENRLWIGTWDNGLYQHNTTSSQNTFANYSENSSLPHKISNYIVSCARPCKNGKVLFGTISGGLNILDTKTDSVYWFTTRDGVASNLIYRIEEDDQGTVWMSTDKGIARFDPATKSFINYNTSSGLPVNNFTFLTSVKCKDGTIAFGTNDGQVVYFNPNSYKNLVNTQPVIVTDIRLFNKSLETGPGSLLKKAAYLTDTLRLNYKHSVISFELANMDFLSPEIYTYAYKLEGFDKDWAYTSDRSSITYTNLDPGTYTLLIKNANHLGIWNEKPTKLLLIVKPPYWQMWWFVSLVLIAIAALIYLLFQYRLKQKLRILNVRNRLHRDLHDDVGATLSSVKAYAELLKENPDNPVIAELIKDNSAEMIERLEVIAWATNPAHDNFSSLKNRMIKFASPLCHAQKIEFSIDTNDVKDELQMPGEVRQNVFLVFKEAINNMIKYSEATICKTETSIRNNQFILQVSDNGKGADGNTKSDGNGWKNMKKRSEELNGTFEIKTTSGNGTCIIMSIPYPFKIPNTWDRNKR